MTSALVTGIAGQDGWYMARRLLALGVRVIGASHRADAESAIDVDGTAVPVVTLDLASTAQVESVIREHRPDEIYNFGARASSAQLFDDPLATAEVNGLGVGRLLEAIRRHAPDTKLCQASSSEVFNGATESPQSEATPVSPRNAYSAAKAFADHLVAAYRATHGIFACSAILFPHESPRRPPHFLVRKVAQAAARVKVGLQETVTVGDLDAVRDWGFSADYVEAMRRMLQRSTPLDYVVATGEGHTVRDVCAAAFGHVGLDWEKHVIVDTQLVRMPEAVRRIGDPRRARADLEWEPALGFTQLIGYMVDSERL